MIRFFISTFTKMAQKKQPQWYRILSLISTTLLIFIIMPFFYLYTGHYIEAIVQVPVAPAIANIIAMLSLSIGVTLIIWTLLLQYHSGKGSGSHIVPTQRLITSGPYKISRHPMLLGAIFFYFGTGTLLSSIIIGFYGAFVTAILAYFFIIYIEEPVLIARFGDQYKKYQKNVPIIPFLFTSFNHSNRKQKSNN